MTRSSFPKHLRAKQPYSNYMSACGSPYSVGLCLPWRSIKRVECKNCPKLIERGVETAYFRPQKEIKQCASS